MPAQAGTLGIMGVLRRSLIGVGLVGRCRGARLQIGDAPAQALCMTYPCAFTYPLCGYYHSHWNPVKQFLE